MSNQDWLPPLQSKTALETEKSYLERIYSLFKKDFIDSKIYFKDIPLALKKHPLKLDKEATFWHMISQGKDEQNRTTDLERCERIPWCKPIIENSHLDDIKVWENRRKGESRILIWYEKREYLIVLAKRNRYLLPWTAYLVKQEHRKEKLNKEFLAYKAEIALTGDFVTPFTHGK